MVWGLSTCVCVCVCVFGVQHRENESEREAGIATFNKAFNFGSYSCKIVHFLFI